MLKLQCKKKTTFNSAFVGKNVIKIEQELTLEQCFFKESVSQKTMQTRNIVIFSKPYEILSMKYLWPSTILGFGGLVGRCIHFVHLAKMEFKLKLCFQNDLIRFIGDKLDKISKLILVCMRYFILIEISYFIRGDNL